MAELNDTTIFGNLNIAGSIGGAVRLAYIDGAPGAVSTVAVFLDEDVNGEAATVTCSIVDGGALNAATPSLSDGDEIYVIKIGGTWYCANLFHAT